MAKWRPFHETILEAIRRMSGDTDCTESADILAGLIMSTKIPKGHDEIIATWKEHLHLIRYADKNDEDENYMGVPASVLEQKEATEKK